MTDAKSDTLIDLCLHSGDRSIWAWKYIVSYTYDGFEIRSASEECNDYMLESATREARELFGDWPIHVISPHRPEGQIDYPSVRVTAFFTSLPMSDEMHLSSMIAIWFQHTSSPIPNNEATEALKKLSWQTLALDYET